jgi:hypothetical protein
LVPRLHRLLVIAESTDALLGNLFELEDLGAKDVKGISEPVGAWAAVRQSYDGCPSAASRRRLLSRAPWESYRVSSAEHALGHAEHKAHHLPAAPALQAPAAEAVAAQPLTQVEA